MIHHDSVLGAGKEREENSMGEVLQSLSPVSCRVGSVCPCSPCLNNDEMGNYFSTGAAGPAVLGS